MLRLLITSAGSLVGQNILDALERRREEVRVIGADLSARSARIFRCDRAYLTPATDDPDEFERRIVAIIERETPDLWLAGRDHDVLAQARLRERRPDLARIMPVGPLALARMMQDKLETQAFAHTHGLAIADGAMAGPGGDPAPVEALLARVGFPLLAKPVRGYGSLGVRIIPDRAALDAALAEPGLLFQEYLDPPPDLADHVARWRSGMPLFFQVPEDRQRATQAVIGPDGAIGPLIAFRVSLTMGRCEVIERDDDPDLLAFARRWTEAVRDAGWVGSFNIQCKRARDGAWRAFELGGRCTGSTGGRRPLGHDEVGELVRRFVGPGRLRYDGRDEPVPCTVVKSLTDGVVPHGAAHELETRGVWPAP